MSALRLTTRPSFRRCRQTTRALPCCSGPPLSSTRRRPPRPDRPRRSNGVPVMMWPQRKHKGWFSGLLLAAALLATVDFGQISAQVRAGRRGAVAKGENATVAAGPRGAAVKGEEGYAAAGRRGAVASGEEGYAAVGRHGAVATGEELDVNGAVGRRGAVVVGEEGAAA